jgi:hypothetical protein
MSWTRALNIVHWADTQDARHTLPRLVRRLIRSTVPSLSKLNFPAGEQVTRPGFDGTVETPTGNEFVPQGLSRWEMGVDKNVKGKADEDFAKRTDATPAEEQEQTTFVFVTPRVWEKKSNWEKDAANSNWRKVIAYDANDLEHWLEIAPAVDVWLTKLLGRSSPGVQELESYWNSVRTLAEHPLLPSVFTASREAAAGEVRNWLAGLPSSLYLRTNSLMEGIDFLAALNAGEDIGKLQSAVIISNEEAWRHLAASRDPLLLIADPTQPLRASDAAAAVEAGHHVFVTGTRGVSGQANELALPRQTHLSIAEALQQSGFSQPRAAGLGQACAGSSGILKRLITRHPETHYPAWAREEVRNSLAPLALIGGWSHVDPELPQGQEARRIGPPPPQDVWLITEFLCCSRTQLDETVSRWQRIAEPLFLRFGSSVLVSSREDVWHLLGGCVSREQLNRFRDVALLVLDENNPALDLEPDQRWLAKLYGKAHSLSEDLRISIIETLALMTTYRTADRPETGVDFSSTVNWILDRALPNRAPWQRWASFGHELPVIAEAAPELFLCRVEEDLSSPDPELPKLFQDQSHSFFAGEVHTGLLRALELLAWSTQYLARVSVVLARLAARDPGGRYYNRPHSSLEAIFMFWLWQTSAPLEERMCALSQVLVAEPEVGWRLLVELLPSGRPRTSHTTCVPRWRDWAEGRSRGYLQPLIPRYLLAVAHLTIQVAGSKPQRWAQAFERLLWVGPAVCEQVCAALESIARQVGDQQAAFPLWESLRNTVARHERHPAASWSFPQALRTRLASIRDRLQSGDPVLDHQWLFQPHVELPGFDILADFERHDTALQDRRLTAVRQIVAADAAAGVFRFLRLTQLPATIGWIVGEERLLSADEVGLPCILDSADLQHLQFATSYVQRRFVREGVGFTNSIGVGDWSADQAARFATCLPYGSAAWQWLRANKPDAEEAYWRRVGGHLHQPDLDQVREACGALARVGRPCSAADVAQVAAARGVALPSDLIADVLEAIYTRPCLEQPNYTSGFGYHVRQLVDTLQRDVSFDRFRLAGIEWGLLPFLGQEHDVGPSTLVAAIESHPQFFVTLLEFAYRGEADPPSDAPRSEQDQVRAHYALTILNNLSRLPGTNEAGITDYDHLRNWVRTARQLASERGRLSNCDRNLGALIARASIADEGRWPAPEVAALAESLGTDEVVDGFALGVLNARGAVTRSPWDGGDLERRLSARYRELAEQVQATSPKLAQGFRKIADHYDANARHEDDEAERRKLGR